MTEHSHVTGSVIDHNRRSVCIPRRLMPVLLAMHAGKQLRRDAAVDRLRTDGLVIGRRLDPLVTTLIEVMTNPSLVLSIEISGDDDPRLATIWGTRGRAVIGTTDGSHRFELIHIEPTLLPFHLSQATGLVPRPIPPFAGGFSISPRTLDLAQHLLETDPSSAEGELARAGVPTPWGDRLLIALAHRKSLWTVESVWLGNRHRDEMRLMILDAGSAGHWKLAGADSAGPIRLEVTDFDTIMKDFAKLLPGMTSPGHTGR